MTDDSPAAGGTTPAGSIPRAPSAVRGIPFADSPARDIPPAESAARDMPHPHTPPRGIPTADSPARGIPHPHTPPRGIPFVGEPNVEPPTPAEATTGDPRRTTVLVVDDHPLVRGGLISLLSSTTDLAVVAEASGGLDAVRLAAELEPDVILMDLSMPDIGGAEATRRIVAARPDAHIVVLTSFHDQVRVREALEAGAIGFLLKDAEPAALLAAVRSAALGDAPLDPRVARALLPRAVAGGALAPVAPAGGAAGGAPGSPLARDAPAGGAPPTAPRDGHAPLAVPAGGPASTPAAAPPATALSSRETEVLQLITRGLSNKQIGTRLGIAERTVKAHVGSIFRHLGVADRTSAAMWARDHGF